MQAFAMKTQASVSAMAQWGGCLLLPEALLASHIFMSTFLSSGALRAKFAATELLRTFCESFQSSGGKKMSTSLQY